MSRLAAIVGQTWAMALRSRVTPVLALLLAAVVLGLPARLSDDGTPAGATYLYLHWTLSAAYALLCVATAWLGADLLNREVRDGSVDLLATRPVSPVLVWLGRWLGTTLLAWLLLAGVLWLLVLRCRVAVPLTHAVLSAPQATLVDLAPGATARWPLPALPPPAAGPLTLSFRVRCAEDDPSAPVTVLAGDTLQSVAASTERLTRVVLGPWHGVSELALRNDGAAGLALAREDAPRLTWPAGGFAGNLLRAALLMALQLAFLAALGGLAASRLSFPVAAFAVSAWLVAAAHAPLLALVPTTAPHGPHGTVAPWLAAAGSRFGLALVDALHRWWPTARLAAGELIAWSDVVHAAWQLGLLQTGAVVLAGAALWATREFGLGDGA